MLVFIGIVPPSPIYEQVVAMQKLHGDNRVEPHITILRPTTIVNPGNWLQTITAIAGTISPFKVTLYDTDFFDDRVLYIKVNSEGLLALEQQISAEGITNYDEQTKIYHPHLTLGRTHVGFSQQSLKLMQKEASTLLNEPFNFTVSFFRIYYKPSVKERYTKLLDVALQG